MNRILHTKSIIASAATAAILIGGGATAATAVAADGRAAAPGSAPRPPRERTARGRTPPRAARASASP